MTISNQLHWKTFEVLIMEKLNIQERWMTSMFDIPYNIKTKSAWGIKMAKKTTNTNIGLSDARRVFSWFDTLNMHNKDSWMHLIIWTYEQIENVKVINEIFEIYIKDTLDVRKLLYWNITLNEIFAFHNAIWIDFFNRDEFELARDFAKLKKDELQKKGGILKLNPKIDSKTQRRLQCSVDLTDILNNENTNWLFIKKHTNNFLWFNLPLVINSTIRTFDK